MAKILSISEAADELGVPPRLISDLFFQRRLDKTKCPVVGGRRLIPRVYLAEVAQVVQSVTAKNSAVAAR